MSNDFRPRNYQLPWPAAAAALISFAVLAPAASGYVLMGLLALALICSYIVSVRLSGNSWSGWLIRVLLFGTVLFLNSNDTGAGAMMVFNPAVVHAFGELCAVELVIQSWRRWPIGPAGAAPFVLSALIFVAGCDTFDPTFIRLMAPLYMVFVVLALRSFRPRVHSGRSRLVAPAVLGVSALILALLAGGGASYGLWTYRGQLMEWSLGLLGGRHSFAGVGVGNEPTLGPVFDAGGSSQRILRIDGLSETAHFRMAAFSDYHLGSWGPAADRRHVVPASPADLHAGAAGQRVVVTRYDDTRPVVFAPLSAAGIAIPPAVKATAGSAADWDRYDGGPVHAGVEGGGLYTYALVLNSTPDFQGPLCTPICASLDAAARRRCLVVPAEIDPGVRALARRIGRGPLPEQRVQAVVQYLLSHYRYSLVTRLPQGDPISRFLLASHSGHCQYFAASAVMLLRCLGVPARYVDGYYVHEQDSPDSEVVREDDAHAWTECWIDGKGWITVDATPSDGRPDHTASGVSAWQKLKERFQDEVASIRARLSRLPRWIPLAAVGVLAAVMLGIQAWRKLRRRPARSAEAFAYAGPGGDLDSIASRFERILQQAGMPCPAHRPWQEHLLAEGNRDNTSTAAETPVESARVAAGGMPDESADPSSSLDLAEATAFVGAYNAVRFGRSSVPGDAARLSSMLETMESRNRAIHG